jgi:NAD(P)-dependent dehydrogenase (short-subunit alcohol dehydrogenase family)
VETSEFSGIVVMLTGAASGIGRVTAELFAQAGAHLALLDISPKVGEALEQIKSKFPGTHGLAIECDVSSFADCQRATSATIAEFGRIDVLAPISGLLQVASPVKDLSLEDWNRVIAVNLTGPFLLAKAVGPQMISQASGRIVNVASWWGRNGHALFSAYCASKAALIVFTQALAEEMAPYGVTANTVCPGNINTMMHQTALKEEALKRGISFEEMKDREWSKIPLGKAGDPEDIGNAIMFLASERAKYVTGASLDVNGGVLFH